MKLQYEHPISLILSILLVRNNNFKKNRKNRSALLGMTSTFKRQSYN